MKTKEQPRDTPFTSPTASAPSDNRVERLSGNLILVGGPPRSGTSLVARLLGQHPHVFTAIDNHVQESDALYSYRTRSGLVQRLRQGAATDLAAERSRFFGQLIHDDALHVCPSAKTSACPPVPPAAATGDRLLALQDQQLERSALALSLIQPNWRLCLKSPEISFVLPELATLFPHARFILVVRPLAEIAESMFRLGTNVKRFPVYHARWKLESEPPPGIPADWTGRWRTAGDAQRCVLHAAAYLRALADGAERLGRGRCLVYDHTELRRRPQAILATIAHFLHIESTELTAVAAAVRTTPPLIDNELRTLCAGLERELELETIFSRLASLTLRPE